MDLSPLVVRTMLRTLLRTRTVEMDNKLVNLGECGDPVVSVMLGVQIPAAAQKYGSRFLLHLRPLANSAIMSTLTARCPWKDETVRERTDHPPSYAEAKKMKSLTLHTHGCSRASLRD